MMKTQIKIISVTELGSIEPTVNGWLDAQGDISLHSMNILPLILNNALNILIVIIYCKEGWR